MFDVEETGQKSFKGFIDGVSKPNNIKFVLFALILLVLLLGVVFVASNWSDIEKRFIFATTHNEGEFVDKVHRETFELLLFDYDLECHCEEGKLRLWDISNKVNDAGVGQVCINYVEEENQTYVVQAQCKFIGVIEE